MDIPNVSKLLLKYMDQLDDTSLNRFQWLLIQNKNDDGSQPIKRAQLQKGNSSRQDTVDKIVHAYGEAHAVAVTVDIFYRLPEVDMASRLTEEYSMTFNTHREEARPNDLLDENCSQDSVEIDLQCTICHEVFTNPVVVPCGHSFCKACINKMKRQTCPICRTPIPKTEPPLNYSLNDLIHLQQQGVLHNRRGRQPSQTPLRPVVEKKPAFEKIKQYCDTYMEHIQIQSQQTERKIKETFERFHAFLHNEERNRIVALKEEEAKKTNLMKLIVQMSRDALSSSDMIKEMENLQTDSTFIETFRTAMESTQLKLPDPKLLPQALIQESKHLGNLQFKVWEKMQSIIKHTPVILDPNTASPWLHLSDDLTTVKVTDTFQDIPGNPERNVGYPQVLGSEGFDKGEHSWEVEVGNYPRWILGVAKETIDRQGELCSMPQNGLWTLAKKKNGCRDVHGNMVAHGRTLQRITIKLDYEEGTVTFIDPEYESPIHIYNERFTEPLYPYFAFLEIDDDDDDDGDDDGGDDDGGDHEEDVRNSSNDTKEISICQSKILLTMT